MCKKEELKRQKGSGTTEGKQKVKRSFNPWAGIKSAQSVNQSHFFSFYLFLMSRIEESVQKNTFLKSQIQFKKNSYVVFRKRLLHPHDDCSYVHPTLSADSQAKIFPFRCNVPHQAIFGECYLFHISLWWGPQGLLGIPAYDTLQQHRSCPSCRHTLCPIPLDT